MHILTCRFCESRNVVASEIFGIQKLRYAICCTHCGTVGPPATTHELAVKYWNGEIKPPNYLETRIGETKLTK